MFPEITRDEVFRIETPALWLRWPMRSDAAALAAVMAHHCRDEGAALADVDVQAVEALINIWRAEMEVGGGLHLVLAPKSGARRPIGIIHTGMERSCVAHGRRELGDEAADAVRRMIEWLGVRPAIRRVPPMAQQRLFSSSVGFAGCCMQA